jgi:S-adenosylmethionine:tRNA ribosyltransferase-isomerase
VLAQLRASKSPKPGSRLRLGSGDGFEVEVLGRGGADGSLFELRFPDDPLELLERHGHVPLPPYIARDDGADDERRYQTVFAAQPGAVAAPTAALHFDAALLAGDRARAASSAARSPCTSARAPSSRCEATISRRT